MPPLSIGQQDQPDARVGAKGGAVGVDDAGARSRFGQRNPDDADTSGGVHRIGALPTGEVANFARGVVDPLDARRIFFATCNSSGPVSSILRFATDILVLTQLATPTACFVAAVNYDDRVAFLSNWAGSRGSTTSS